MEVSFIKYLFSFIPLKKKNAKMLPTVYRQETLFSIWFSVLHLTLKKKKRKTIKQGLFIIPILQLRKQKLREAV